MIVLVGIVTSVMALSDRSRLGCVRITNMGFFRGFIAPFRGAVFVSREGLWHLLVMPVMLNIALAVGATWAALRYWREELAERAIGSPALASLMLVLATGLGAIVLFVALQPLVGSIFNDVLSERVERKVRGEVPRAPFLKAAIRSLGHSVSKLILYTLAFVAGLGLTAVAAGVGGAVGLGLGALFLAYDGFDYPLSRRSLGFWAKWRYLALHPAQTIGYGFGATVFYFIPLALVVAPPLTAVGATLVYLESESRRTAVKDRKSSKGKNQKANPVGSSQKGESEGKLEGKLEGLIIDETSPLRDGQG